MDEGVHLSTEEKMSRSNLLYSSVKRNTNVKTIANYQATYYETNNSKANKPKLFGYQT